jgi:hypothetical protein
MGLGFCVPSGKVCIRLRAATSSAGRSQGRDETTGFEPGQSRGSGLSSRSSDRLASRARQAPALAADTPPPQCPGSNRTAATARPMFHDILKHLVFLFVDNELSLIPRLEEEDVSRNSGRHTAFGQGMSLLGHNSVIE